MEEIIIEGWKGKGDLKIFERIKSYRVIEVRKSKETKEPYSEEHIVPKDNVDVLLNILETNCQPGIEYKYKYIVKKLLERKLFHEREGCPIDIFKEAFNGGTNRAKYYFPFYYYPMKILEAKGLITYLGRGGVILR